MINNDTTCRRCGGKGTVEVQVEYASYLSGHQLGQDIFEEIECSVCKGSGKGNNSMESLERD